MLADSGYFNGDQVLACEGTGVLPIIPKTQTSSNLKRGLFSGADFIYDVENDHYTCPAGQHLSKGKVRSDRRDDMDHYRNLSACLTCALKPPDAHPTSTSASSAGCTKACSTRCRPGSSACQRR